MELVMVTVPSADTRQTENSTNPLTHRAGSSLLRRQQDRSQGYSSNKHHRNNTAQVNKSENLSIIQFNGNLLGKREGEEVKASISKRNHNQVAC